MTSMDVDPFDGDEEVDWGSAPSPIEVDLTQASPEKILELLKDHIDEESAKSLITRLEGSADDYERNIRRIQQMLTGIQSVLGAAIKIVAII